MDEARQDGVEHRVMGGTWKNTLDKLMNAELERSCPDGTSGPNSRTQSRHQPAGGFRNDRVPPLCHRAPAELHALTTAYPCSRLCSVVPLRHASPDDRIYPGIVLELLTRSMTAQSTFVSGRGVEHLHPGRLSDSVARMARAQAFNSAARDKDTVWCSTP